MFAKVNANTTSFRYTVQLVITATEGTGQNCPLYTGGRYREVGHHRQVTGVSSGNYLGALGTPLGG